ncbi:MAG: hypothetical protein U5N86_05575 [Planctomycetota bacterium]|nr:hypothetical protein [Planctomycetota bacterium]
MLKLRAPREKGFSQGSPLRCEIEVSRRPDLLKMPSSHFQSMTGGRECELVLPATVRNVEKETPSEVILKLSYVFCEEGDNSACVPGELYARLPVVLSRNGQNRAGIRDRTALTFRYGPDTGYLKDETNLSITLSKVRMHLCPTINSWSERHG